MNETTIQPWYDTYYLSGQEFCDYWRLQLQSVDQVPGFFRSVSALQSSADSFLDMGCAGGWYSKYYAQLHPSVEVLGIDKSEYALARAREDSSNLPNLRYENWVFGPGHLLPVPQGGGQWGVILASLVFMYLPVAEYVQYVATNVKKGGYFVLRNPYSGSDVFDEVPHPGFHQLFSSLLDGIAEFGINVNVGDDVIIPALEQIGMKIEVVVEEYEVGSSNSAAINSAGVLTWAVRNSIPVIMKVTGQSMDELLEQCDRLYRDLLSPDAPKASIRYKTIVAQWE